MLFPTVYLLFALWLSFVQSEYMFIIFATAITGVIRSIMFNFFSMEMAVLGFTFMGIMVVTKVVDYGFALS